MRKPRWKAYEMDDMHTVAARTWQEAVEWFCIECGITDKEDMYLPPYQVNMKTQYMAYAIESIPSKRQRRATCTYEGFPCVEIPLKKALKYQLKTHKHKKPFILSVCM